MNKFELGDEFRNEIEIGKIIGIKIEMSKFSA